MAMARSLAESRDRRPDRARERAGALALTVFAYAAVIGLLCLFRGAPQVHRVENRLNTILLKVPPSPPPKKIMPRSRPARFVGVKSESPPAPRDPILPEGPAPAIIPPIVDLPKTDVAMEGPASAAIGSSSQAGGGTGNGSGSGGTVVFKGEWQREPTPNELNRYLPRSMPGVGWGQITCRTIENFRVTDCEVFAEYPKGSGLGEAVRLASHTFRIKPPIVDGRPMIGAWVRIVILYNSPIRLY